MRTDSADEYREAITESITRRGGGGYLIERENLSFADFEVREKDSRNNEF